MGGKEVNISDYCNTDTWKKINVVCKKHRAPFLLINLESVEKQYTDIKKVFPGADVFYAYKANPDRRVAAKLAELGSNFDAASRYEIRQLLSLGVSPDKISYGNTIKKAVDIRYAYEKGIRLYTTDCMNDMEKISKFAPNSRIIVRIFIDGSDTAQWPLTKKFGCESTEAIQILCKAKELGLKPQGISFHVGSQQNNVKVWENAIIKTKYIFDELSKCGIKLETINLGGGFPTQYDENVKPIEEYATSIQSFLRKHFKENQPKIMLEPGRYMVGSSGIIVTEVVLIKEDLKSKDVRWIFCDIGKYSGVLETIDESIKYPIYCDRSGKLGPVILAGPTCDSTDIMYEKYKYNLPEDIKEGDLLYFFYAGAYTRSCCSVEFNGFPPLKTYFI